MTQDEKARLARDAVCNVRDPELRRVAELAILRHLESCICEFDGPWYSDCPAHRDWRGHVANKRGSDDK